MHTGRNGKVVFSPSVSQCQELGEIGPLGLSETWDTGQERVSQCSVAQVSDMKWAWSGSSLRLAMGAVLWERAGKYLTQADDLRYLRWQGCNLKWVVKYSNQPVDELCHCSYRTTGVKGCRLLTTQEIFLMRVSWLWDHWRTSFNMFWIP